MAFCSSGSAAAVSSSSALSGCRKFALSSRVTLPSSAMTLPSPTWASGLTSTSVASVPTNGVPQLDQDVGDRVDQVGRELRRAGDLAGLGQIDAGDRVDRHLGQRVGTLDRELLDLHAALVGRHREEGAVGAVEQVGDVVLLLDVGAGVDEHAVHGVALDVHAEDLLGVGLRVVRRLGDLDAAGLAAAADLDLRLDDGDAADLLGDRLGLVRRRRDLAEAHRHAVVLEQLLGLVLEQIHADCPFLVPQR